MQLKHISVRRRKEILVSAAIRKVSLNRSRNKQKGHQCKERAPLVKLWPSVLAVYGPGFSYSTQFRVQHSTILRSAPRTVFMCFVWIWEQTAIISLYSIDWLVCITETECVYCAVRTGCLSKTWIKFRSDSWLHVPNIRTSNIYSTSLSVVTNNTHKLEVNIHVWCMYEFCSIAFCCFDSSALVQILCRHTNCAYLRVRVCAASHSARHFVSSHLTKTTDNISPPA